MSSVSAQDTATANLPPAEMMVMAGAPDMGLWINFLNFVEYRPIPAWTIIGSVVLIGIFSIVEFFHRRKKNKDKTQWTKDNPDLTGPDIQ